MKATRLEFMSAIGASALASALPAGVSEKPKLRIGITTDTHFGRPDVHGTKELELAWNLFKAKGCEMVVNCGDIADRYYPQHYAAACQMRERVFPDPKTAPREVWVYAGHDRIDMPDDTDKRGIGNFAALKAALKIPHEAYDSFSMAGFEFVVVPQTVDMKRYESLVKAACARKPKQPVFVFDHVPGQNTTEGSGRWGCAVRRAMLAKYPQVVHITGHSHGSLGNEQNVFQAEYTSVSAGCLTYFNESYVGAGHHETGKNRMVLVLELFSGYAIFRRYSIDTGVEIGADEPWTIRWPYDPRHPFYSRENMRARHTPAEFAAGARLAVEIQTLRDKWPESNGPKLKLTIPTTGSRFTRHYRVEAFRKLGNGTEQPILRHDVRGDFWKEPSRRSQSVAHWIDAGFFVSGEPITIKVTPCDFWGGEGKPIVWQGKAPEDNMKVVWQGELADKSYKLPPLPPETDGKHVRVAVDAEVTNFAVPAIDFGVKPCDFWWVGTVSTPPGASKFTYVFYIRNAVAAKRYEFAFRGGAKGWKIKFSNLRLMV